MMPPSIQVCPIEIPGRGRREGEPSINEISQLATALAHALPLQVRLLSITSKVTFLTPQSSLLKNLDSALHGENRSSGSKGQVRAAFCKATVVF